MLKKIKNHPKWGRLSGELMARYIAFTRRTSDNIMEPEDPASLYRQENPFILSVWHGQFLLIPTIRPDDIKAKIVVGSHGDAEIAAKVVSEFGVTPIRGSGAAGRRSHRDRGGAKVLKQAIKALSEGYCIVSTADVPPGPAQKVGHGILTMARLSGRPILPAAITTRRALTFKSWSRLTINLPWSKCALVVGDPISIPRTTTEAELENYRLQLEGAMRDVTNRAHSLVGRSTKKIRPIWEYSKAPGLQLKLYRWFTKLAKPLAPYLENHRLKRGKEIKERVNERYGKASIERPSGKLLWLHAASVGETNAVLPLINSLIARNPALSILLTTGTVTSASLANEQLPERAFHQFIPLDNPTFIDRFLTHWRPDLAAFVESEIWPNLIQDIAKRKIPLLLINGRLSKRSFKRWFKKPTLARPLFGAFDKVLARGEIDARRFTALGADTVIHSGNLKVDAPPPAYDENDLAKLTSEIGNRPLFVAASTHQGEEEKITNAHKMIALDYPGFLTIIVPRHPNRGAEIKEQLLEPGLQIQLRSENPSIERDTDIYIADTLGELGLFYSLTDIAFMGGSLIPHGGQNPIEPVKLGANVITGPHIENFGDAYFELFVRGGAYQVKDASELAAKIVDLLRNPSQHALMQEGAAKGLEHLSGSLNITLNTIETYLQDPLQS